MATPHRRLLEKGASDNLIFNRTTSDDSYATDTSEFDTNMVIILAVLLCALMFALGLNMVARCGIPYINRSSSSSSSRSSPQPAAVPGIKKRALRQLPHGLYGLGPDLSTTECPICLGEFVHGEKIRVLPKCSHGFHVVCIDTWLMSHASCPNCRVCVLDPPPCTAEPRFDGRVAPNLS